MAQTDRGAPFPFPSDPNNAPHWIEQLAEWVSQRPGVAVLTTAERNDLEPPDLWNGRVIVNTTTDQVERWIEADEEWVNVLEGLDLPAAQIVGLIAAARLGAGSDGSGTNVLFDDGNWRTPPFTHQTATFDVSGVYNKPAGATRLRIILIGAGAGGGGNDAAAVGGGGGAMLILDIPAAEIGATLNVVIGAAGTGGTTANGPAGGATEITLPNGIKYSAGGGNPNPEWGGNCTVTDTATGDAVTIASGGGSVDDRSAAGPGAAIGGGRGAAAAIGGTSSAGGAGGFNALRGGHGAAGLRKGGATGLAGANGNVADAIPGGGGGGAGGVGGKYGGGGGARSAGNGAAGGQGGAAIITYFD